MFTVVFYCVHVHVQYILLYRYCNIAPAQAITPAMARAKCYHTMDAFMKLVVVLVRYSGDATNNTGTKVNLLNKVRNVRVI